MKKQILKNMIIRLSLENSIITQFTSFIAVEKRVRFLLNVLLPLSYLPEDSKLFNLTHIKTNLHLAEQCLLV